jgi:fumarylacetoacetase
VAGTAPTSWVPGADGGPFGLATLPYGVFTRRAPAPPGPPAVGVRIGDHVLDVGALAAADGLVAAAELAAPTLDPFLALGPPAWREARAWLTARLAGEPAPAAGDGPPEVVRHLVPLAAVDLHLPFTVADYVDFYASEHHATNVGRLFRPGQPPLPANWRHLPIGYHGRAGTVAVSGTPVVRPCGQRRGEDGDGPTFGPSRRLDIEAEVGFVVGVGSPQGTAVPADRFADHVFGACLVNDWSARDIQAWEYVPLGPFLGKSFLTSVSPWVVPLDALRAARVAPPAQEPAPLGYLRTPPGEAWALDLALEVRLNGHVVSRPPFAGMYWTAAQQLAHLTVNGASLRTGDLFASGTVSGADPGTQGSLLELSWGGATPVALPDGTARAFLEDGDEVAISATAPGPGGARVGFGAVTGRVVPAQGPGGPA